MLRKNVENEISSVNFLTKTLICFFVFFMLFFLVQLNKNVVSASTETNHEEKQFMYLTDLQYVASMSKSGYGAFGIDQTTANAKISVKVENAYYTFDRGIWAHATSYIVYDISEYSNEYKYFSAYMGLNQTAASSSNGVKFSIYTSNDGVNWGEAKPEANAVLKGPGENATFVKIDISGAKYLKLYTDSNGSNGNDHSVFADTKLIKEGYTDGKVVEDLDVYDAKIKAYNKVDFTDEAYELLVLQREFVKNVGNYALQRFVGESDKNKEAFEWLFNDLENLHLYVLGGTPDGGSYYNSLTELSRLYDAYKNDFEDKTPTNNKWYPELTKGDVYKKMAISLSLTHSTAVGYWAQINHPSNRSDSLVRYSIFKQLYDNGQFVVSSRQDHTPWFEALQIEEMRYIMNSIIDDEEIIWLNEYTQKRIDAHPNQEETYLQPHTYIAYVWPNFANPIFHDPDKKDYWDEVFEGIFSKYGVTYSTEDSIVYKAWMSMRNEYGTGAVCGGISKLGTHIRAAHGTPASVISQPGHAAIIYYRKDSDGNGYWTIDNDISGWSQSGKTERLSIRMPLGWGNDSYVNGWAASYIALSQEALNHNEDYEKSEELIMVANVYNDNPVEKEKYLRESLKALPYNVDAWWELIKLYQANPDTTEAQYFELAKEVAENLKAFPLPMYNLTNLLKNNLTSTEYSFAFTILQTRILTEGKNLPNNTADSYTVYQPSITRTVASFLLGQIDTNLASFSFDGENAEQIVLGSRFDGNGIRWDYSLDGKKTWKEVSFTADEPHKLTLTKEEINSITSENDIYVHIVGANYSEENLYKIDILESVGLPSTLYANDLENKLIAAVPSMQWKYTEEDEWTFYKDAEPDLTGDKTIIARMGATGVYLASKDSRTFQFTQNEEPNTRKYIPVANLSIQSVSSQATGQGRYASNAIDANIYTSWHSDWAGGDRNKFIVIQLEEPKNLTALEYLPLAGGNGKIESAQILVSMDGENWTEVVSETNWTYANTNDISMKSVDFEPTKAQYIKIVGKKTQAASSSLSFIAAAMFNLYENADVKLIADFSFDGENAGKIILADEYKTLNWQYSIDGGNTWKNTSSDTHQLTEEELAQINENDKIKVRFDEDSTEYSINIKKGSVIAQNIYVNDWENRLIGITNADKLEWQLKGSSNWISYQEQEPVVTGDNTLLVRTKARGLYTASDATEYQFTQDTDTEKAKYISIQNLSIAEYSSQSKDAARPYYAPNAIDGNINTEWHTDFSVAFGEVGAFITIKLDKPRYISALEYIHMSGELYGYMKTGTVYVSEDNIEWKEAGKIEDCSKDEEIKRITLYESMYAQYIKLEIDESHDNNVFATAAMINLYEDTTMQTTTVIGDIDGDGKLTINDLAQLKLHLIDIQELPEERLKIADIDGDGKVTINDLAQLKLLLLA